MVFEDKGVTTCPCRHLCSLLAQICSRASLYANNFPIILLVKCCIPILNSCDKPTVAIVWHCVPCGQNRPVTAAVEHPSGLHTHMNR